MPRGIINPSISADEGLMLDTFVSEEVQNHKAYIRSHQSYSMLYLLFTNIFIHIQQLSSYSRNIFIRI